MMQSTNSVLNVVSSCFQLRDIENQKLEIEDQSWPVVGPNWPVEGPNELVFDQSRLVKGLN